MGTVVQSDSAGQLTVIIETEDISAPSFVLKDPKGSSELFGGKSHQMTPMAKFANALSQIHSPEQLRDIRLDDGECLVDQNISKEDLGNATTALKDLRHVFHEIQSLPKNPAVQQTSDNIQSALTQVERTLTQTQSGTRVSGASWDFFTWVADRFKDIAYWTVKKLSDGWKFIVQLGKDLYHFALDTLVQVGKAIYTIFEYIGAGLKKLVKWVGFLFQWNDILDTQAIVVNLANLGFLWGLDGLQSIDDKARAYIADLRAKARDLDPTRLPKELEKAEAGKGAAEAEKDKGDKKTAEAMNSHWC